MTPEQKQLLDKTEDDYCELAVKVRSLQKEAGFSPGAKVRAQSTLPDSAYPSGDGVIAKYGDAWMNTDWLHVPVVFGDNRTGLYRASQLTLLTP
jgi:hypothetical protein